MKIGLELHQRLDSHKLFCSCPSIINENGTPDGSILRRLHPVFSELGEIDRATRAEFSRDRTFVYQTFRESCCLVETDEEPPHDMNVSALATVLEISSALKATPVDEIQVMRKIVIDGSNTGGFQRTAVVAMNGLLETSKGPISIPLIAIEEESAGIISNSSGQATYRLDRLGIPLIEISTTPDIKDGEHLKEVAEKLGLMLRATGKVARGLGTVRQDVNVSIEGGARVEIKGAQDLKTLPLLAENEVKRQTGLLGIIREVKTRFNGSPKLAKSFSDVSEIFANTQSKFISNSLKNNLKVYGVALPKHAGLLGMEIQPGRRYGSELSDYAKPAGVKGIIHSDEDLSKYGLSPEEQKVISSTLHTGSGDAFVLVVASEAQAKDALSRVVERALFEHIPEETRRANPDSTSSYMRPLPGRARLYPETDIMAIPVTKELLSHVKKHSSDSLEEKRKKLSSQLPADLAEIMLRSKKLKLYEQLVALGSDPKVVATTLENTLVSLRREGVELKDESAVLNSLFKEYNEGKFVKSAIPEIIKHLSKGSSLSRVINENSLSRITGKELEKIAVENNYDMRKIMQSYGMRVDSEEVGKILKKRN